MFSITLVLLLSSLLTKYTPKFLLPLIPAMLATTSTFMLPAKIDLSQHLSFLMSTNLLSFALSVLSLMILALIMNFHLNALKSSKSSKTIASMGSMIIFFCIFSFSVSKMIYFYVLFELSLIPMFLIITGWGYQPERMKASLMMMFYTLAASLPFLLILVLLSNWGLSSFDHLPFTTKNNLGLKNMLSAMFSLFVFLSFLVKLPMFLLHLWLPQAHVEAPTAGSMVLAAILLKLGGYGMIRMNSFFSHQNSTSKMILIISMFGGALASLSCIQQIDLKVIVAYSSVAHMAMMITSSLINSSWGTLGAILILVSHGFSSSGLFFGVGLIYQMSGSRSIFINKGYLLNSPIFALWWALLCAANMGSPPTLNLMSEILACLSLMSLSPLTSISIFLFLSLSVFYNLNLYSATNHGEMLKTTPPITMNLFSNLLFFSHLTPIFTSPLLLFIFFSLSPSKAP